MQENRKFYLCFLDIENIGIFVQHMDNFVDMEIILLTVDIKMMFLSTKLLSLGVNHNFKTLTIILHLYLAQLSFSLANLILLWCMCASYVIGM